MSDDNTPSDHQWTRLLAEMQRSNQIWGGVARSVANNGAGNFGGGGSFDGFMKGLKDYNDKQEAAATQQRRTVSGMLDDARSGFNRGVDNVSGKLKLLGEGSDGALAALKGLARGSFLGAIVGQLIDYGTSMVDNYRKMNDAGQGFVGGMTQMGKAAAAGGVTMDELVRITQKNAAAMSRLGGPEGFLGLAMGVRDNIRKYGMLGMTVSQINDLVGDYTDTMRIQGRLDTTSRAAAAEQISKLATNASILSQAFGQSREEILKQTAAAQRDAGVVSYRETLSADLQKRYDSMMNDLLPQFAALPGEAGKTLASLATQIAGHMDNPGIITSGPAKDLMDHGMADMVFRLRDLMQRAIEAPTEQNKKALADYRLLLGNTLAQLAPSLRLMDATGQKLAALGPAMRQVISAKQLQDAKNAATLEDSRAALTRAAMGFEDAWLKATGELRLKMYNMLEIGLGGAMKGFENFKASGGLQQLQQALSGAASAIFRLFGLAFSGNFAQDVATATQGFLNGVTKVANGIEWLADKLQSHGGTILAVTGGFMGLKLAFGALGLLSGGTGVFGLLLQGITGLAGILGAPGLAAMAAGIGGLMVLGKIAGANEDEGPIRGKLNQIRQQMAVLESELSRAQSNGAESDVKRLLGKIDALKQERAAENAYLDKILADREVAGLVNQRQSIQQDIARLEGVSEHLRNQNAIDGQKNALKNVNEQLEIANKRADAAQQASLEVSNRAQQYREIKRVEAYEEALPRDNGTSAIVNSNQMLVGQIAALNTVMGGVLRGLSKEEQVFILQNQLANLTKRRDAVSAGSPVDPALTREIENVGGVLRYLRSSIDRNTEATQKESNAAVGGEGGVGHKISGALEWLGDKVSKNFSMAANASELNTNEIRRGTNAMIDSQHRIAASQDQKLASLSVSPADSVAPVTSAVGNLDAQLAGATDEINNGNARLSSGIGQVVQALENMRKDGRDQTDVIAMLLNLLRKDTRETGTAIRNQGD
jgi:hypothetical protein